MRVVTRPHRPAGPAEVGISFVALLLILAVAWHGFGVYLCLDDRCPGPNAEEILVYRVLVVALGAAVVAAGSLAVRRRADWALVWHAGVAMTAVVAAVLFAVPSVAWDDLRHGDRPEPSPYYVPCHSGSGDCPGGG